MKTSILFFIFSPFFGLIKAFKNYKAVWAKNAIWFFVIFFGFTMYFPPGSDVDRYNAKLESLYYSPVNWDNFSSSFFSADYDGEVSYDIYAPIILYCVSTFTNNGNVLFGIFAIVFGYFFSRNIGFLFDLVPKNKMNIYLWILLISFTVTVGFWQLPTVRMWTAAHIFFYGAYIYIIKNNYRGLLIVLSSILVHFSFALPVAIFLLYFFVRIPYFILYVFFITTFFISEINVSVLGSRLESILPTFLLPKVKVYTDEDYGDAYVTYYSSFSWFMVYFRKAAGWFITFFLSYIFFSGRKFLAANLNFRFFYSFTLFFLAIGNIMNLVTSGSRYLLIAYLFAFATIFYYVQSNYNTVLEKWMRILSPLLVFYIIVSIRLSLDTISISTIFLNPFLVFFLDLPVVSILNAIQ
ncbi:hypothetical protein QWY90_05040 [Flavobacterium paronense]|uniref:EpsG family protein n=1 Tax=Flavobacterium paronense TaxID=1392775 RepID=A0ABV5GAM6_9FLAO|nr:hypothetical protein [Flavobacterium paronense]MDN3676674.1 hypothetical protein [Flavobacterium paronense]